MPAVEGVDPATDDGRVRLETDGDGQLSPPAVLDGRAFVADGTTLYALVPGEAPLSARHAGS